MTSLILDAIEREEVGKVEEILKEFILSRDDVDNAFEYSLAVQNVDVVSIFLRNDSTRQSPSSNCIIRQFYRLMTDGSQPDILYMLQQAVPPMVLAEAFRAIKRGESNYVVDINEPMLVKEFIGKFGKDLTTARRGAASLSMTLRRLNWTQDAFHSMIVGNRLWALRQVLLCIHEYIPPQLLQSAINEAFGEAVIQAKYQAAVMLACTNRSAHHSSRSQVNQDGFDAAVVRAIEDTNSNALDWLMSGRLGFLLSEPIAMELYRSNALATVDEIPPPGRNTWYRNQNFRPLQWNRAVLKIMEPRVTPEYRQEVLAEVNKRNEINRAILIKRQRRQSIFRIPDAEIHSYSGQLVASEPDEMETSAADAQNSMEEDVYQDEADIELVGVNSSKGSLNAVILSHMKKRILNEEALRLFPNRVAIEERLVQLIESVYTTTASQEQALHIISQVLRDSSVDIFRTTLAFLEQLSPEIRQESTSVWLAGFLSESISARSCNPGALERVVTGLRGISDPSLARLFSHAEGPHLARTTLTTTFNIYSSDRGPKQIEVLSRHLLGKGVTDQTSSETICAILQAFARELVCSYVPSSEPFEADIELIVETVMDGFESHIRPVLHAAISSIDGSSYSPDDQAPAVV